jgi:hypothetical protein
MNLKNVLLFVERQFHSSESINLFINEEWKMASLLKNMIQQKIKSGKKPH